MQVTVADAERIVEVCAFAKMELGFNYLVDLSTVDNYGEDPRWTVVYELAGIDPSLPAIHTISFIAEYESPALRIGIGAAFVLGGLGATLSGLWLATPPREAASLG